MQIGTARNTGENTGAHQIEDLRQLKDRIYRQRTKIRLERERAERCQEKGRAACIVRLLAISKEEGTRHQLHPLLFGQLYLIVVDYLIMHHAMFEVVQSKCYSNYEGIYR